MWFRCSLSKHTANGNNLRLVEVLNSERKYANYYDEFHESRSIKKSCRFSVRLNTSLLAFYMSRRLLQL